MAQLLSCIDKIKVIHTIFEKHQRSLGKTTESAQRMAWKNRMCGQELNPETPLTEEAALESRQESSCSCKAVAQGKWLEFHQTISMD
jgi:hypothetical protein